MGVPGPDVIYTCKRCGDSYHPKSARQQCCNKPIKVPCVVCGKLMDQICTFAKQKETCSKECNNKLIPLRQIQSNKKAIKICDWCGKEFHPSYPTQKYCDGPHYQTCELCGKQFEINVYKYADRKTCSDECRYILANKDKDIEKMKANLKSTMLRKYGVENAMHVPELVNKIKETNLKRYGKEYYTQTQEYRDKVRETDLQRYGVDHHLQSQKVIEKRIQTNLEKYGVDNPFKSEDIKKKIKESNLEKYGVDHISKNSEYRARVEQHNLEKYGVEYPSMLPEVKEKVRKTNFEKFGVAAPTQSHIKNIENWYKFINDPRTYINENYESMPRTQQLADDLGVDLSTIDVYLAKHDASDCVRRARSLMEEEIIEFIRSIQPECKIISNSHKLLQGKEIDIYLPDYAFGIECNPTVTHNSSFKDPWGGDKTSINYHKRKTDLADRNNIFLMHIFGYEWSHKKDILKSMISNILGCNTKIYARKCKVRNVTPSEAKFFLQANHRQGFANSSVYLGLEYNDELVAIMTFGKMRATIGIDSSDLSECWELIRFCCKLNTSVVGGASKLFKYFINEFNPIEIRSFSDRAHTRGTLYSTLGFKELRRSGANYVWVNIVDDKAYHRINAQKRNLRKFLKDDTIDLTLSENQIMESHGYARVYDSGTITWQWLAK